MIRWLLICNVAILFSGCAASFEFGADGSRKFKVEVTDGKAVRDLIK